MIAAVRALVAVLLLFCLAACVDRLPDQDLRIRGETPIAKMSVDHLWQDFQADAVAARSRYWGKAIEVSGTPTRADGRDAVGAYLLFAQAGELGVRAHLLDDTAAEIVKRAAAGERLTLKCYCDGLDGHVLLKSCISVN
jgi:hypothetical protein